MLHHQTERFNHHYITVTKLTTWILATELSHFRIDVAIVTSDIWALNPTILHPFKKYFDFDWFSVGHSETPSSVYLISTSCSRVIIMTCSEMIQVKSINVTSQHSHIPAKQQTIEDTSSCTSSSTSRRQHPFTTHAPLETSVPVFNKDPGNRSTAAAANYQDSTIWWNLPGYLFYLRINQLFKQCGHHVDFSLQADSSLCTHSTKRAPWLSFWASLVIICIINHCMYK